MPTFDQNTQSWFQALRDVYNAFTSIYGLAPTNLKTFGNANPSKLPALSTPNLNSLITYFNNHPDLSAGKIQNGLAGATTFIAFTDAVNAYDLTINGCLINDCWQVACQINPTLPGQLNQYTQFPGYSLNQFFGSNADLSQLDSLFVNSISSIAPDFYPTGGAMGTYLAAPTITIQTLVNNIL